MSLVRLISDQLSSLLVWRADELNLRCVADSFLAFGPDVAKNLAHVCRAAGTVTNADEEVEQGRGVRYDERAADACLHLFRDEGFAFTD